MGIQKLIICLDSFFFSVGFTKSVKKQSYCINQLKSKNLPLIMVFCRHFCTGDDMKITFMSKS